MSDLREEIEGLVVATFRYGQGREYGLGDPSKPEVCNPDVAANLILREIAKHDRKLVESILADFFILECVHESEEPETLTREAYKFIVKTRSKYLPKEGK